MTTIPAEFKGTRDQSGPAGAYSFKLLKRQGKIALYQKTPPDGHTCYEVVILKTVPERHWPDGRTTPEHEAMPSPEEWGVHGCSPATLERGEEIFKREIARQPSSIP